MQATLLLSSLVIHNRIMHSAGDSKGQPNPLNSGRDNSKTEAVPKAEAGETQELHRGVQQELSRSRDLEKTREEREFISLVQTSDMSPAAKEHMIDLAKTTEGPWKKGHRHIKSIEETDDGEILVHYYSGDDSHYRLKGDINEFISLVQTSTMSPDAKEHMIDLAKTTEGPWDEKGRVKSIEQTDDGEIFVHYSGGGSYYRLKGDINEFISLVQTSSISPDAKEHMIDLAKTTEGPWIRKGRVKSIEETDDGEIIVHDLEGPLESYRLKGDINEFISLVQTSTMSPDAKEQMTDLAKTTEGPWNKKGLVKSIEEINDGRVMVHYSGDGGSYYRLKGDINEFISLVQTSTMSPDAKEQMIDLAKTTEGPWNEKGRVKSIEETDDGEIIVHGLKHSIEFYRLKGDINEFISLVQTSTMSPDAKEHMTDLAKTTEGPWNKKGLVKSIEETGDGRIIVHGLKAPIEFYRLKGDINEFISLVQTSDMSPDAKEHMIDLARTEEELWSSKGCVKSIEETGNGQVTVHFKDGIGMGFQYSRNFFYDKVQPDPSLEIKELHPEVRPEFQQEFSALTNFEKAFAYNDGDGVMRNCLTRFIKDPQDYLENHLFTEAYPRPRIQATDRLLGTLKAANIDIKLLDFSRDEVFQLLQSSEQTNDKQERLKVIANRVFSESLQDFSSYFILQFPKDFIQKLTKFSNNPESANGLLDTWYASPKGKEVAKFWYYAREKGFYFDPMRNREISKTSVIDVFKQTGDLAKQINLNNKPIQRLVYAKFMHLVKKMDSNQKSPGAVCNYLPINPEYIAHILQLDYPSFNSSGANKTMTVGQYIVNEVRKDQKNSKRFGLPIPVAKLVKQLFTADGNARSVASDLSTELRPYFEQSFDFKDRAELAMNIRSAVEEFASEQDPIRAVRWVAYNYLGRLLNKDLPCGFKKIAIDWSPSNDSPTAELYKLIDRDDILLGSRADIDTEPSLDASIDDKARIRQLIADIKAAISQGQTIEQFVGVLDERLKQTD